MPLCLRSTRALANAIGLEESELFKISSNISAYYKKPRLVPKSSGTGMREISRPTDRLKVVQRLIDRRLLRQITPPKVAYGGIPGRDHIKAAERHVGRACVANIDIQSFFPSVSHKKVYSLLTREGCAPDVARLITRLVTINGCLPQGSPASMTLANLVLPIVDKRLEDLEQSGLVCTRFVDDISISGQWLDVKAAVQVIIPAIHAEGLQVSRKKIKVQRSNRCQSVTNLNVNTKVSIPRSREDSKVSRGRVRGQVRLAKRRGLTKKVRAQLQGKINYLAQLHPRIARKLRSVLDGAATVPVRSVARKRCA